MRHLDNEKRFIRAMVADEAARQIVSSVVSLARHYAMTVVAEGIENRAMAEAVRAQACDHAQGFAYDGALPPDEAGEVIASGREGRYAGAV